MQARGRRIQGTGPTSQFANVMFLNNDALVVSEEDATGELSKRETLSSTSAFVLAMQVVNASTGSSRFASNRPTRALESSVQILRDGILVRAGSALRFYNAEMKLVSQISLPEEGGDKWEVLVSNSQQTVLLRHYDSVHNQFEALNPLTGKAELSWSAGPSWPPLPLPYSISDKALARVDPTQHKVLYSRFGSNRWVEVQFPDRVGCLAFPVWVNTTSLLSVGCGNLSVVGLDGGVLTKIATPKKWAFDDRVALSQNQEYVATKQDTGKGGGLLDRDVKWTGSRIVVYSLSSKSPVLTVNVWPLPHDNFDFALSPDGSKLAVLTDSIVSVYLLGAPK